LDYGLKGKLKGGWKSLRNLKRISKRKNCWTRLGTPEQIAIKLVMEVQKIKVLESEASLRVRLKKV